jgi:hypothetical protein
MVRGFLGSAGCQPAAFGSLPNALLATTRAIPAEEMSGKLPDMAAWQPALPGMMHPFSHLVQATPVSPNSSLSETKITKQNAS